MKTITTVLLILSVCLLSHTTSARTYIGGSTGEAEFDVRGVDEGESEKYFIGFQIPGKFYGFELSSLDTGEADISNSDNNYESIRIDGYNISAVYNTVPRFGFKQPMNLFFKIGYYLVDTEVKTTSGSLDADSNGFSFGAGLDYAINDAFSLKAEIEGLYGVDDFADDDIVTFITLGAQINF